MEINPKIATALQKEIRGEHAIRLIRIEQERPGNNNKKKSVFFLTHRESPVILPREIARQLSPLSGFALLSPSPHSLSYTFALSLSSPPTSLNFSPLSFPNTLPFLAPIPSSILWRMVSPHFLVQLAA